MRFTILANLKALLGITDNSKDTLLNIFVDESIRRVSAYLHRTEEEIGALSLETTLSLIAKDLYQANESGSIGKVASISEADRSISFSGTDGGKVVSTYDSVLRPLRKLVWDV